MDTIEQVNEIIQKIEEYRNILKWASRDPDTWAMPNDERTKEHIKKCKAELLGKKKELITYLKNILKE